MRVIRNSASGEDFNGREKFFSCSLTCNKMWKRIGNHRIKRAGTGEREAREIFKAIAITD